MSTPASTDDEPCWAFEQRFTWRASTVSLLGSLGLVLVLQACRAWRIDAGVIGYGAYAAAWLPLISALLAAVAFIGSLVRRAPQLQFVVELVIAVALEVAGTLILGHLVISGS